MADLKDLTRSIFKKANAIEENATDMVRKAAITIGTTVIFATPVDTGLARSSWLTEVDRPAEGEGVIIDEKFDKTEQELKSVGSKASRFAIDLLEYSTARYRFENKSIHITNNVNYISFLNEGSSDQAPENFVEIAIETAVEEVERVRLLNG